MPVCPQPDIAPRRWESFGYADFRWFWTGSLVSRIGNWARNATIPYALFQMTHEPVWVGAAGFAYLFPQMLTCVPGGHLADRYRRRDVLLFTHAGLFVFSLLLIATWANGSATPWVILLLSAASSTLSGLQMPAVQTVASEIVPRGAIADAIHLNVVAAQAGRAIGPLCAGFIIAHWGVGWAFAMDAAAIAFAFTTLLVIRPNDQQNAADTGDSGRTPNRRGWVRETWELPGIAAGVLATAVISLFGAQILFLATLLADDRFGVEAKGYGGLVGAFGIGAFLGALLLSLLPHRLRRSFVVAYTGSLFGIALVALAGTGIYVLGVALMAICGICFSMSFGSLNAGIQTASPPDARGKTVAFYLVALNMGASIGSLIGGWASDVTSPAMVTASNGALLVAAMTAIALSGSLRALDSEPARNTG